MTQHTPSDALYHLAEQVEESQNITVLTGAGISVASGIQPFRKSADAVWERDVTELATRRFFNESPLKSWQWYLQRFDNLTDKEPNPAHYALTSLGEWCRTHSKSFTLITQNIDTLHRKAGSTDFIEIHGRADAYRCTQLGCKYSAPHGLIPSTQLDLTAFKATPDDELLPRCPECHSLVRPHVLWFDEMYTEHEAYQFERALSAFDSSDLIICSGTSFSVGITELAIRQVMERYLEFWVIDPSIDHMIAPYVSKVELPAEEALPELIQLLTQNEKDHT